MKTLAERFEEKYIPVPETGCWLWLGACDLRGYGIIHTHGANGTSRAHRVSWELHYGPIPDGQHVLHKCDVPCCVNPAHLFLGTQAINLADMRNKGRQNDPTGERHPKAKLTDEQVQEIRSRSGIIRAIAKDYGITHQNVSDIRRGKTWKHL